MKRSLCRAVSIVIFGLISNAVVLAQTVGDRSSLVDSKLPTNLSCGRSFAASLTFKNTGISTWTSSAQIVLMAIGGAPFIPPGQSSQVPLPAGVSVPPGSSHTFSFTLTAPEDMVSGSYLTSWRMRNLGGGGWFGATAKADVQVGCLYADVNRPAVSEVFAEQWGIVDRGDTILVLERPKLAATPGIPKVLGSFETGVSSGGVWNVTVNNSTGVVGVGTYEESGPARLLATSINPDLSRLGLLEVELLASSGTLINSEGHQETVFGMRIRGRDASGDFLNFLQIFDKASGPQEGTWAAQRLIVGAGDATTLIDPFDGETSFYEWYWCVYRKPDNCGVGWAPACEQAVFDWLLDGLICEGVGLGSILACLALPNPVTCLTGLGATVTCEVLATVDIFSKTKAAKCAHCGECASTTTVSALLIGGAGVAKFSHTNVLSPSFQSPPQFETIVHSGSTTPTIEFLTIAPSDGKVKITSLPGATCLPTQTEVDLLGRPVVGIPFVCPGVPCDPSDPDCDGDCDPNDPTCNGDCDPNDPNCEEGEFDVEGEVNGLEPGDQVTITGNFFPPIPLDFFSRTIIQGNGDFSFSGIPDGTIFSIITSVPPGQRCFAQGARVVDQNSINDIIISCFQGVDQPLAPSFPPAPAVCDPFWDPDCGNVLGFGCVRRWEFMGAADPNATAHFWDCSLSIGQSSIALTGPYTSITAATGPGVVFGDMAISGWATDPDNVRGVLFFVDNDLVQLDQLSTGLPSPIACEVLSSMGVGQCDPNSGFSGTLDTLQLSDGNHKLQIVAVDDHADYPRVTIEEVPFAVDNTSSPPPFAPSNPDITSVGESAMTLTWTDNSDNETLFRIGRQIGLSGLLSTLTVLSPDVTSYTDAAVAANTTYCYRIRAENNDGDSAWTDPVCANSDMTPPTVLGAVSTDACALIQDGACYVADADFTIEVSPATDADSGVVSNGYHACRSKNVHSWGGCNAELQSAGPEFLSVAGDDRPEPGKRRAYYFQAVDSAGNWSDWYQPLYVQTIDDSGDTTPPGAPGATTSPDCVMTVGGVCYIEDEDFTITVTPAGDAATGVDPDHYRACRSEDTTGFSGCSTDMNWDPASLLYWGGTSHTVIGSHRPAPGNRRAYMFRAVDHAGNWGAWSAPLYVETLDVVVVASYVQAPGEARVEYRVTTANPSADLSYFYDESLGSWQHRPQGPCNNGSPNPTYFEIRIEGSPIEACTLEGSWLGALFTCRPEDVADLNEGAVVHIMTDDYIHHVTSPCAADLSQPHISSGQPHWMNLTFTSNGITMQRSINFTKQ